MKLLNKTNANYLNDIQASIENALTELDPSALESMAEDFQSKFDDLGEHAQEGERGQALSSLAYALAAIFNNLENAIGTLQGCARSIDSIVAEYTEA